MISGMAIERMFQAPQASIVKFPVTLNRLTTTTRGDNQLCLVLEPARGIDLVQLIKLLAPKLRFDPNPDVF